MKPSDSSFSRKPGALNLLGLPVHPVQVGDVHEFIRQVISEKKKAAILNLNIHGVNLALKYNWMKDFFKSAQLVFCDGDGVRWGLRLLGKKSPPKITYDRWFWQLADFCAQHNYRLYFLGSQPGVAEQAAQRLKEHYPQLLIAGTHHGYFSKTGEENEKIITEINHLAPDILVLGLGMPFQERWLYDHSSRVNAHIFLTGGAVFDCISGQLDSPPQWMVQLQMEWFFRFLQQPKKRFKRYFIGNFYFFYRILLEMLKRTRK